jgi:hypothetical protein
MVLPLSSSPPGFDPVVHAQWPSAIWINECSAKLDGSPGQVFSPGMTSLFVVAVPLRTRALLTPAKAFPRTPPLKRREAERQKARTGPHRKAMRRAPFLPSPKRGRPRSPGPHGAGALAFRRPTAALRRGFIPGSARAALPGITGCKREDPLRHQCSEHLAVRHAPDGTLPKPPVSAVYRCARREPLPLRLKEYPREKRPSSSGILVM